MKYSSTESQRHERHTGYQGQTCKQQTQRRCWIYSRENVQQWFHNNAICHTDNGYKTVNLY